MAGDKAPRSREEEKEAQIQQLSLDLTNLLRSGIIRDDEEHTTANVPRAFVRVIQLMPMDEKRLLKRAIDELGIIP